MKCIARCELHLAREANELNEEVGKNFPDRDVPGSYGRRQATRGTVRVLMVDAVLGSRFSLVQAASQPGFTIDASGSVEDARAKLARGRYALVLADTDLGSISGIDFLAEIRLEHPETARALVATESGMDFKRSAIARGGLSFLLTKPWSAEDLRRTLRELFGVDAPVQHHSRPTGERCTHGLALRAGSGADDVQLRVRRDVAQRGERRRQLGHPLRTTELARVHDVRRTLLGRRSIVAKELLAEPGPDDVDPIGSDA